MTLAARETSSFLPSSSFSPIALFFILLGVIVIPTLMISMARMYLRYRTPSDPPKTWLTHRCRHYRFYRWDPEHQAYPPSFEPPPPYLPRPPSYSREESSLSDGPMITVPSPAVNRQAIGWSSPNVDRYTVCHSFDPISSPSRPRLSADSTRTIIAKV
ncbi:hypothetical protein VKT23_000690 [Stygiomarasmius scandens]|uniref:Uncharacterized protein n=1 Tax=Marasmiellus scandens TaxID=2682957 RepID=A0ABR1K8P9_9AGAR